MKSLHSVYIKILLIILLIFTLPLSIVFFYSYSSLESTIQQKIEQQARTNFDNLKTSLQNTINQISQTATYISTDMRVSELLTSYNNKLPPEQPFTYSSEIPSYMDKYEFLQFSSELRMQLSNYTDNWLPENAEISLLLNDGQFLCTWSNYNTDFKVLTDILNQSEANIYFSKAHKPLMLYNDSSLQFSLVKNFYSIYDTRQAVGKIIITMPVSTLEHILNSYQNEDLFSFYILNPQKDIITQALGKDSISAESMALIEKYDILYQSSQEHAIINRVFIDSFSLEGPSWQAYLLVPYSSIFRELIVLRQTVVIACSVLIILLTIVSLLLLYRILSPLRKLTIAMYQVKTKDWNIPPFPVRSKDEIGDLTEGFNYLMAQLHLMFEKIEESERQKGELKFEILLAQINPHFLFNTLNSIKWMAMMTRSDNIVETIRSLARLLEISMNRQTDVISIMDEVKNLRSYLDIQTLRYSELFTVTFDIDPCLENLECLKLVFQPFVENAIFYNIQDEKLLNIHILGMLKETTTRKIVVLKIIDNGKGMSEEQIHQVLSNDTSHEKSVFRGIGINNVHQRIQLKYGNSYGVSISSRPGHGLNVTIRFPAVPFVSANEKGETEK